MSDEQRPGGALARQEILALLHADPPLVSGLEDESLQIQPNGLDARVDSLWLPTGALRLGCAERQLPERRQIPFDANGWLHLAPGAYVARLCEVVSLPPWLMALGFPRSTLLRSACGLVNAVWDAGYSGRSEVLLVVWNPAGLDLQQGARILQLVFFPLGRPTTAYDGAYQHEHT